MGGLKPPQALQDVSRLLLDTGPVINILERVALNDRYAKTWAVLNHATASGVQILISPLTLMEVLAKPGATEDELKTFAEFCLAVNEIEFRPVLFDDAFSIRVGWFRRTTRCKLPDCIQFAAAEVLSCDAILTNDDEWTGKYTGQFIVTEQVTL